MEEIIIWLNRMPLSPSVNDSLMPIPVRKMNKKTGRTYMGGAFTATQVMRQFKQMVQLYGNRHEAELNAIRMDVKGWIEAGFVLSVDMWAVFHEERIFSAPNKKVLRIDTNNRLKGQLDAVSTLLGIDDAYFFGGHCEKVTCSKKEEECAIIKISPMKPRTLQQIHQLMRKPDSSS